MLAILIISALVQMKNIAENNTTQERTLGDMAVSLVLDCILIMTGLYIFFFRLGEKPLTSW